VAGTGILSAKQIAELEKALAGLEPLPQAWESVDVTERWTVLDIVAQLATGKLDITTFLVSEAEVDAHLRALREIDWKWVDWNAMMKRVNHFYDAQVAIMKKPNFGEMQREQENMDTELVAVKQKVTAGWGKRQADDTREAYTQRVGDGTVSIVFPSLSRVEELCRRSLMEHEMAKAMLAAGRYRAEKGKWPEKLETLVPGYLKELPTDMYSGKNVLYAQSEKGIRIYSVGPNHYDDGGFRGALKDGRRADDIVVGVEVEAGGR